MNHKEARAYILLSLLFASIILAVILHGPRLAAYISTKSGYHSAKAESGYQVIPITVDRAALHAIIADTPERRMKGLSHRPNLGKDTSMLFVFGESGKHGIWMKDMNFSIDIMWFDEDLRVIHIEENVSPDTYPHIFEPKEDAAFVLETNAGFAEKNDITIGSELVLYR